MEGKIKMYNFNYIKSTYLILTIQDMKMQLVLYMVKRQMYVSMHVYKLYMHISQSLKHFYT